MKRTKPNKHSYLTFRSMKIFSTEIYEDNPGQLTFPDYKHFIIENETYSDLASKIFDVVNKVALTKAIGIKNNTNEYFDEETAEKIAAQHKLFRKFEKPKLRVDEILYKEAGNAV